MNGDINCFKEGSFKNQCMNYEFGEQMWILINEVFDLMPISSIVDNSIFCTHGGIPRRIVSSINIIQEINKTPRPISPSSLDSNDLILDLLWSDPAGEHDNLDEDGFGDSKRGGDIVGKKSKKKNTFFD